MYDEFFTNNNVEQPNKPITQDNFTRWGKNQRYSATLLNNKSLLFTDFKTGNQTTWSPPGLRHLIPKTCINNTSSAKVRQKLALKNQEAYLKTAILVRQKWNKLSPIGFSKYLINKRVRAVGIKYGSNFIAVPIYNISGALMNMQYIYDNGDKRFFKGAQKKSLFGVIGNFKSNINNKIYVAEGYSTAATIYMATGNTVIIAFDAGNIEHAIANIKSKYPYINFTIAGDNDQWSKFNIGKVKALNAAKKHKCRVVLPDFYDRFKDQKPTDFNDLFILRSMFTVRDQLNHGEYYV